jgi:hypothetical protein
MKKAISIVAVAVCLAMVFSAEVSAQPGGAGGGARGGMAGRGMGINGDWMVSQEFNGMQMQSILSFSRNQDGNMTGQWIGFGGVTELQDVSYENGQLTFKRTMQGFGGGEPMTQTFKGTITDDKLTGTVAGGQGDAPITGQRAPRLPRAAGIWQMAFKIGDREMPVTLTIGANQQGEPTAKWASERGEAAVSDLQITRNEVSFKVKSDNADRSWEATFTGTMEQDTLSGTMKSEMGEIAMAGQRMGADLIGTWNLQVTSERGTRPQRLLVNPDLSALYGATPVKKVDFKDGKMSFKIAMEFGERSFEMDFAGKIQDSKLEGELTTEMGSQKITGTKMARRGGRRAM